MSEQNDGGPAFPTLWQDELRHPASGDVVQPACLVEPGMSLRDWFAGQALVGMLSDTRIRDEQSNFAMAAYRMADAMLAARKGRAS